MLKKYLTLIIAVLVINLSLGASVFAGGKQEKEAKLAVKVKASVAKLGTGKDAQVVVKLKDGTRLKGYISEIADDYFSVMNSKTGTATAIDYRNAKQVHSNKPQTGLVIFGIVGGIVTVIALVVAGMN